MQASTRIDSSGCSGRRGANGGPRRGAIIVELLLALPVLIILLVAAIEFGVMLANFQQISLAGRDGALVASEVITLDSAVAVPPEVSDVINKQLAGANMTACQIRLEHNVGGPTVVLLDPPVAPPDCDCDPGLLAMSPSRPYVRVTVCVDMEQAAPNCLAMFGFDLSGQTAEYTTLLRYEAP
jgi:hypothetical protein